MSFSARVLERLAGIDSAGLGESAAVGSAPAPDVETADARSTGAGVLTLVCTKCTRFHSFHGADRQEACRVAAKAGWDQLGKRTICPRCPK